MDKEIIGHSSVLNFFEKVIHGGNLSHAYCFVGGEELGKRTVAEQISARLLSTTREKLNTMPDFRIVTQVIDEKTGKTKKDISIVQLKEVRSFLSQRPFISKYKVVIIDNAQKMSINAANALLKTLEEPSKHTVLFLIAKDARLLPQTIQSRCQIIYFHGASKVEIAEWLKGQGVDQELGEEMSRLCVGLPGRVVGWLEDLEKYEEYKKEIDRFVSLYGKPLHKKMQIVEDLFGDKKDHIAARGRLQKVLSVWQLLIRDSLYSTMNMSEFCIFHHTPQSQSSTSAFHTYEMMEEAKGLMSKNVHPKLLVEKVLLTMS